MGFKRGGWEGAVVEVSHLRFGDGTLIFAVLCKCSLILFYFLIGKDTEKCILIKTGHPTANPKHTTSGAAYRQKNKRNRDTKNSPALIYTPTTQKS